MPMLEPSVLDQLFHAARTHNVWLDKPAMASAAAQPPNVPGRCAGAPTSAMPVYTTAAAVQMTVVHASGSSPRVTRAPTVM